MISVPNSSAYTAATSNLQDCFRILADAHHLTHHVLMFIFKVRCVKIRLACWNITALSNRQMKTDAAHMVPSTVAAVCKIQAAQIVSCIVPSPLLLQALHLLVSSNWSACRCCPASAFFACFGCCQPAPACCLPRCSIQPVLASLCLKCALTFQPRIAPR